MKNLKFKTQLFIGFTLIIVLSLIFNTIAIYELLNIKNDTELIVKHPFTVSNAVKDININITAIHRTMKDLALAETSEEIEIAKKLVNYHDSIIHNAFIVVIERYLGDKKAVMDTYKSYNQWEIIRTEVVEFKIRGLDNEAIAITRGKGDAHVKLLVAKTDVLINFALNKADEFYNNVQTKSSSAIKYITILVLVLLVISISTSFFISKNILKPIHDFIAQLSDIFLSKQAGRSTKLIMDEKSLLDYTIIELKSAHGKIYEQNQKLSSFNAELEMQVNEKTKKLQAQNEEYQTLNKKYSTQNKELFHINAELEESEAKLKTANTTKDKFFSIIAHDLRSPFSSLLGFSKILLKNYKKYDDAKRQDTITIINRSADKAFRLVDNLLTWSRSQSGQIEYLPQNIDLKRLLSEIISTLSGQANAKNIQISDTVSKHIIVFADINMLETIFRNLISNAIKFTHKNGEIRIDVKFIENNAIISVSDTGMGIEKDNLEKVFNVSEKISTEGTERETGTGLGLILCKEFTEKSGGKIWVESEIGKGSSFYFTIPYLSENTDTKKTIYIQNRFTILIAEDEEINYLYIETLLEDIDLDINIIHATHGKEAVEICKNNKEIDLVLMDMEMPIMTGYEATNLIKEFWNDLPIVAQTANIAKEDKSFASGCDDFIAKPISKETLNGIMEKYLMPK